MQPIVEQIPIHRDNDGRMRVGNTRVLLNLVVYAFWQGSDPETIVSQYSSLTLADAYLTIGYYLRHREELDLHMKQEDNNAKELQKDIEAQYTPQVRAMRQQYRIWAAAKRQAVEDRLNAEIEKQKPEGQ